MLATRVRAGMRRLLLLPALALLGCSGVFSPDGPDISLSGDLNRAVARAPVLQVTIGGRQVNLPFSDGVAGAKVLKRIRGPRYGDVPVRVALVSPQGDSLAAVTFRQDFERDNNHWVSVLVGTYRPQGFCIGVLEVIPLRANAFPESAAVQDTLFVMHGRIPKDAIC